MLIAFHNGSVPTVIWKVFAANLPVLLQSAFEVWGKVMFSQVFVSSHGGLHSHNAMGRHAPLSKGRPLSQGRPLLTPRQDTDTSTRYGQQVGGTHPGMHTC